MNVLVLVILPVLTILLMALSISVNGVPYVAIGWAIILSIGTILGITAGYHRLYSHRSWDPIRPIRLILVLLGTMAGQNSVKKWSSLHRLHHSHCDEEQDPYNIQKGFWHAHVGWALVPRPWPANTPDIDRSAALMFQDKYYFWISMGLNILVLSVLSAFSADPLNIWLFAGFGRMVWVQQISLGINSMAHRAGKKPSAQDHLGLGLLTLGEGFHKWHHDNPTHWSVGPDWQNWDMTGWFIRFLVWLGWAKVLSAK